MSSSAGPGGRGFLRGPGALDLLILEVERLWGKEPGWWRSLEREDRVQLLAWYQARFLTPTEPQKAPDRPRIKRSGSKPNLADHPFWGSR